MTVELDILKDGTIEKAEDGTILEASSSSVLLHAAGKVIVVDTSMPHDAPHLLESLEDHGCDPDEVDMVINTHGHHDHTGCNRLFANAEIVIHRLEGTPRPAGRGAMRIEGDIELVDGVRIIETPGHSQGSISVVAEVEEGPWVMSGDALPTVDNFLQWVPPGINYDEQIALESMTRILDIAWMIMPGHGGPFPAKGDLVPGIMGAFY